mgnify:CR=1 FL=1
MDNNELIVDNLSKEITELVIKSREKLKDEMNNEQIKCYWDIGRKIIEEEQKGKSKAEYGKGLLINLSKKLKNIMPITIPITNKDTKKIKNDLLLKILKLIFLIFFKFIFLFIYIFPF